MDMYGVSFVTTEGYLVSTGWDGVTYPGQIYYTQPCATTANGQAYLNDGWGGSQSQTMLGKTAVFSKSRNSWMVPTTVIDGYSTSVAFASQSIDNPDCGASSGQNGGWLLRTMAADRPRPAGQRPDGQQVRAPAVHQRQLIAALPDRQHDQQGPRLRRGPCCVSGRASTASWYGPLASFSCAES